MKKTTALLLLLSLCLSLAACGSDEPKLQSPVSFYYPRSEVTYGSADSVIGSERREAAGYQNNYIDLLGLYLKGPISPEFKKPMPAGTELLYLSVENGTAIVTLSDHIARITGMELTVACACLAKTVMAITGAEAVDIRAHSQSLGDTGNIMITKDNILLLDDAAIQPENNREAVLP